MLVINGCSLQDTSDGLAVTLGIAAATGLGLLAFSEVDLMSYTYTFSLFISNKEKSIMV